jgi:hypothetical protein
MSGGQMETPARGQAQPGLGNRYATAAGTPNLAKQRAQRQTGGASYTVQNDGQAPFFVTVKGRVQWALDRLRKAGPRGVTPIDEPGPRWSAYVFDLRALGVNIETVHEPHGGDYPGTHGRYVLHSIVRKGGAA